MSEHVSVAYLTVKGAAAMRPNQRHEIANWLRKQAEALESEGLNYSSRFRARYLEKRK